MDGCAPRRGELGGVAGHGGRHGRAQPWLCSREWRVRGWRLGTRFATWPKGGRHGQGRGRASRTALAGGVRGNLGHGDDARERESREHVA